MIPISINGASLEPYGFKVMPGRTLPAPGERTERANVPGRRGAVRTGATVDADMLVVPGTVTAEDAAQLRTFLDALAGIEGECVVWLGDYEDREWVGFPQQDATNVVRGGASWTSRHAAYTLAFWCPDPAARARVETVAVASPSAVALEYGNADMPLRVEVANAAGAGAITRIVVELRNAAGVAVRKVDWTGSLSPGDTWAADAEAWAVTNDGANARGGNSTDSVYPWAVRGEGTVSVFVTTYRGTPPVLDNASRNVTVRYRKRWRTVA